MTQRTQARLTLFESEESYPVLPVFELEYVHQRKANVMSTTVTFQNVDASEVSTTVPTFDRTNLILVSDSVSQNGKETVRVCEYILAEGDDAYSTRVRVEIRVNPNGLGGYGSTGFSIRLTTDITEVDDSSGELLMNQPISGVIAVTLPGVAGFHDVAQLTDFIGNLYTLTFNGVDANTDPNTNVLDKFKYGIPHLI